MNHVLSVCFALCVIVEHYGTARDNTNKSMVSGRHFLPTSSCSVGLARQLFGERLGGKISSALELYGYSFSQLLT